MPRASKQQARYAAGRCLMLWSSNDVTQQGSRPKTKLVPSYSALCRPAFIPAFRLSQRFLLWGFGAAPVFACWRCAGFKSFWPLALVHQALPAIIFAALRRFRGSVLFHGPRPSSSQGAPFWPSGLTVRRSRPPTAAAELRALVPSPALCAQPLISALCLVQGVFKPFWPPALVQQAPAAIILAAVRRFRGPALFGGLRPCPSPGASFWPSGLTLRIWTPPTTARA